MRISIVGLRGLPGVMGGVESHCEELLPRVKDITGDHIVVVTRSPYTKSQKTEFRGLVLASLPAKKSKNFEAILHTLLGILHARFVAKSDIVHIHAIGPALLSPFAKMLGLKVVVTHHSKNYDHNKWSVTAKAMLRLGEWCAVTFADKVIAVSRSLASDLQNAYPSKSSKIAVIRNGAPQFEGRKEDGSEILRSHGLESGRFILAVGRLTPEKGMHDLISAFRRYEGPCKLVIVGAADLDSPYSAELLKNASDRVVFTGFLRREQLHAFYSRCSLFVVPSYHEGLSIAALEAVSAGAPTIMSNIDNNLELELGAHCYFQPGNIVELIQKLESDHASYKVDSASVLRSFDWNVAAEDTAAVYSDLLSPKRSSLRLNGSAVLRS